MNDFSRNPHPEPETLAAFVEGNVKGAELVNLAEHLRGCEECRLITGEAARFDREEPRASRFTGGWWWAAAAVAISVVAIGVVAPRFRDPLDRLQPSPYRSYQGRLSAFEHAPFRVTRSAGNESDYARLAAAAALQEQLTKERSAANLHRFALAQMALGKTEAAVQLLEEASKLAPGDAPILSDLAAAQIAAGDIDAGAENAARAVDLDPRSAAAAFNLALGLELLSNKPAAIAAWEKVLELDPGTGWALDAREHLRALRDKTSDWEVERERLRTSKSPQVTRSIVAKYPQRVRHFVQDEVVPSWARTRSPDLLGLGRTIAAALNDRDPFLEDLMRSLSDRPAMIDAIELYATGRDALRRRDLETAAERLAAAGAQLRACGSPLHVAATIFAATSESYLGRPAEALKRLADLERQLGEGASRYPSLMAELHWVRGLATGRLNNPNRTIESYYRGLAFARLARESETEAAIGSLIVTQLDRIGRAEDAQQVRRDVLRRLSEIGASDQRLYTAYAQAAIASFQAGQPRVGLAWVESQAEIARRDGDPLLLAEVDAGRALGLKGTGRTKEALAAIESGRRSANRVKTEALRDRVLSDLHFIEGIVSADDPARAERSLAAALDIWDRHGWRKRAAAARLQRGDALRTLGDRPGAEAEYRRGIADFLEQRSTLNDPAFRFAYFERSEALFARIIALLVDERRFDEALEFVEQRRARILLEQFDDAAPLPEQPLALERIPLHTAVVEIELLDDGAAIWSITSEGIRFARSGADGAAIRMAAQRHRAAIDGGDDPSIRREGRWLYEQLYARVEQEPTETVVFAPAPELSFIPFSALVARDNRFLIEHRAVGVAPSASVYLASIERTGSIQTVLAVAAPEGAGEAARLPVAREEAAEIAKLYRRSIVLAEEEMTIDGFLSSSRTADVIHFAGHGVGDGDMSAYILLDGDGERRLGFAQVSRHSLARHPVVVLAACGTARGTTHSNEGVDSIANAFLRAGARTVVATLWDLDDASSSRLFIAYHRALSEGVSTARALRNAQLEMLRSERTADRQPSSWAAAVVIGST